MTRDGVMNEYFEWLLNIVCDETYTKRLSHRKLLMYLHNTEFVYSIDNDDNRAEDGIRLRERFAADRGFDDISKYLNGPCSVLEMVVALSIRCEEHIMDDPDVGDRTGQWFWTMIVNLGLSTMTDERFDKRYVVKKVKIFLDREYEPNGEGGLFTVKYCRHDMRTAEIWYQMCWYLDSIV